MENKQVLKLIDGDFVADEARSVLLDLINTKIRYHSLESLNISETGYGSVAHSQKRIQELEEVRQSLKSILDYANHNGMYLKVNGSIEIELVEVSIEAAFTME
jgi:hypothetical protein